MTHLDRREFLVRSAGSAAAIGLIPNLEERRLLRPVREPLKVALLGAGRQGRAILGELAKFEQVEVSAICDVDERRLKAAQRRVRGAEPFASVAELLEKRGDIAACIVATPTHLHRGPAVAALEAGRHVYCEAPLASTLDDGRALVDASRRAAGKFVVGLPARSNPVYQLARSFLLSGALQRTVALDATWNRKIGWGERGTGAAPPGDHSWRLNPEVSLGLAGEVGSLQIDAVNWFTRARPEAMRGHGSVQYYEDGREVADTVHLEMRYSNGLLLHYQASLCSSIGGQHEMFRGSNATIKMADTFGWMFKEADSPVQGWEVYASRERFHNDEGITLIADATKLAAQGKLKEGIGLPNPPLYYALEDFLGCVLEDKKVRTDAAAGYEAAVAGIFASRAVAAGGEEIEIGDAYALEG